MSSPTFWARAKWKEEPRSSKPWLHPGKISMIQKRFIYFKHIFYLLLFILVYVLQTTPKLFEIWGIKPLLVVPLAITVSVYEGDFTGGLYGILAGIFCDMSAHTYFGFNAILMLIFCTLCGIVTVLFIRQSGINVMLLSAGALFLRGLLEHFFYYALWGYEDIGWIFLRQVILGSIYTALFTPLFVMLIPRAKVFFDSRVQV